MSFPVIGTSPYVSPLPVGDGGTNSATAAGARTNLGVVIGTDVLAPNGSGAALTGIVMSGVTGTKAQFNTACSNDDFGFLATANVFTVDQSINGLAVGKGAGSVSSNTALGVNALAACTTGTGNTAIGNGALDILTEGTGNTAVGSGALGNSSTSAAASNTAVGAGCLSGTTTGSENVGLGHSAGNLITTGTNNVVLGYDADVEANSNTNSIVIGKSSVGQGSNTTVLGNTSTTECHIYGAPSGGGNLGVRLTSDFTTTLATNTDTGLSFAVAANEVWMIDIQLTLTSPAAGTRIQITTPASATVEGWALLGAATSVINTRLTAINTLTTITTAAATTSVIVRVLVANSSNAGTIALGACSVTATQTTTILAKSFLMAQRVL